ncbi:MAG: hypothetical protein ACXWPM_06505 [Bdellovibrionota bacterium]
MITKSIKAVLTLMPLLAISAGAFAAGGPCKDKQEAKHQARKAVHECLDAWSKDRKPADADPTDDCSAKVASFVQASKDVKACHVANQKK